MNTHFSISIFGPNFWKSQFFRLLRRRRNQREWFWIFMKFWSRIKMIKLIWLTLRISYNASVSHYNGLKPKVIVEENWWVLEIFKKLYHNFKSHIFLIVKKNYVLEPSVFPCQCVNMKIFHSELGGKNNNSNLSLRPLSFWKNHN